MSSKEALFLFFNKNKSLNINCVSIKLMIGMAINICI